MLLLFDNLVNDTVEGFGMIEAIFSVQKQLSRDHLLQVATIFTDQLLYNLKFYIVVLVSGILTP